MKYLKINGKLLYIYELLFDLFKLIINDSKYT